MKRLCVFCGSRSGNKPIFAEQARQFGQGVAARGLELVFGGGHIGLMGILADAALKAGSKVIGVIPQALVQKELAHRALSELHVVQTMHERKALMNDLADAFTALPGGFGTADELFEILTWSQLGIHSKPIGVLNINGFFNPLITWLDDGVKEGFLGAQDRGLVIEAADPESLLEQLLHGRKEKK